MLYGEKVILRAIRRADLELLCQYNNDVAVEIASGGDPPYPQSLERLQAEFDTDAARGGRSGTTFAIETDGHLIGQCALFHFDEIAHTCELGIVIGDKEYWGQGFGSDAIKTLLDYAFRLRNLRKVFLTVNASNIRAIQAYTKCRFVEEGRLRKHVWSNGAYIDLVYMGILREEWQNGPRDSVAQAAAHSAPVA